MVKNKSFVRVSAAFLATLTLMSGKVSAVQPVVQQPMMQPVMYPVQQLNVKEQMMLQNNAADNQIALQNNSTDNAIKVQDNYFKNMKDYRDSDPFIKLIWRAISATVLVAVADEGAGWYATGNPWWWCNCSKGDEDNIKAAEERGCKLVYNIANKVAGVVTGIWTGILLTLKIVEVASRASS